jgi:hypothetical protein
MTLLTVVLSEVAKQRLSKHVPAAMNTHVFSMRAVSYQIHNVQ